MVELIQRLNIGNEIELSKYASDRGTTSRTIKNYLNAIKKYFLNESLRNKHGTWSIKKGGFLRILGLSAEELAVLIDILNKAENHVGVQKSIQENIVKEYREKIVAGKSRNDQEKISTSMKITIQTLNRAIELGKKVSFTFNGYYRIIQPCQVFIREYYWYLSGYEEQKKDQNSGDEEFINKMKTYSVNKIRAINVIDESVNYDFTNAIDILNHALNGYISWEDEPQDIHLLVHEHLANNIDRAGAYKHWIRIHPSLKRKGYILYKTKSVHREFKDIIPTIMKHAPEINVLEPMELMKALHIQTEKISKIFVNQLPAYDNNK
ncbi:MAG: putative DNA-binding transcriptional regulator YafY [Sulfurimonas sp.]|jgi:predicted DNA-binding transcriptional regulator YafY